MKLWPPLKRSHPWSVLGISSTLEPEVAAAGWGKLVITSAPITSHWEAFQMEGEVDNEVTAVIMQRRAIFEQEYIQLRQTHPSLPAQLRDFQVSCIPAHLRPEKKTLVRCLILG